MKEEYIENASDPEIGSLIRILSGVNPVEVDRRPLPGSEDPESEFSSRLETGIDCDFVFRDSILIGNL